MKKGKGKDDASYLRRKLARAESNYESVTTSLRDLRGRFSEKLASMAALEAEKKAMEKEVQGLKGALAASDETVGVLRERVAKMNASRDRWRESYRHLKTAFGREGVLDSLDSGSTAD